MVEEDPACAEDAIGFTVIDGHPVRIQLGHAVGAAGIEGRVLGLRNRLNLAKHFGGGRLIEADLRVDNTDPLQEVHRAKSSDLSCRSRLLERNANKALGGKIINLGCTSRFQHANAATCIGQVKLKQIEIWM